MNKSVFLCLNLLLFLNLSIISQDEVFNLIQPPAPDAENLGKYGEIPVSLNQGIPNINIPFYSFQGNELALNLSISYHGSGIKVAERASWVGLGWVLNAGGVITRTVKGLPDEATEGYFNNYNYWKDNIETTNCGTTNWNQEPCIFRVKASRGVYDLENDDYYFNFDGLSGRIIRNEDQQILLIPNDDYRVSYSTVGDYWVITAPDGTIYYFNEQESSVHRFGMGYTSAWYLTSIVSADYTEVINFIYNVGEAEWEEDMAGFPEITELIPRDDDSPTQPPDMCNCLSYGMSTERGTTFVKYLDRIEFSKYNLQVKLISQNDRQDISHNESLRRLDTIKIKKIDDPSVTIRSFKLHNNQYFNGISGYYIRNVYHQGLPYESKRLKLEKLEDVTKNMSYKFEYNTISMPSYFSPDYDHWGYYNYNGTTHNKSIIPTISEATYLNYYPNNLTTANKETDEERVKACMLEKIIYPTGGYTEFEWEPHKYWQEDVEETLSYWETLTCNGGTNVIMTGLENIFADYINNLKFDEEGYPVNVKLTHIIIGNSQNTSAIKKVTYINQPIQQYCKAYLYKTNIPEYYYDSIHYHRILDLLLDTFETYFPFDFTDVSDPDYNFPITPNEEFHVLLDEGCYLLFTMVSQEHDENSSITAHLNYLKTEINPYKKTLVGGVRLKRMTHNDGSVNTVKDYKYVKDYVKSIPQGAPSDFDRCDLKLFYNGYNPYHTLNSYEFYGYCGGKQYVCSYLVDNNGFPIPNEGSYFGYYEVAEITDEEQNGIIIHKFLNEQNDKYYRDLKTDEIYINNEMDTVKTMHNEYTDKYYGNISAHWQKIKVVKAYGVNDNCTSIDYGFKYLSGSYSTWWRGLESVTESEYEDNVKTLDKITYYIYDGAEQGKHNNPTRVIENTSDNKKKGVLTYFPPDYLNIGTDNFVGAMKNFHIINKPVEQLYYESNPDGSDVKVTGGRIYNYQGHRYGQLSAEYLLENTIPIPAEEFKPSNDSIGSLFNDDGSVNAFDMDAIDQHYASTPEYNITYDSQGKIREINHKSNGISAYLWGYNHSFLIAVIENSSYADVKSVLEDGIISSINDLDDNIVDSILINIFNELRGDTDMKNAMITSYTYDPLKGMTSQTAPNGMTTYYEYDNSGRLITIRNNDKKILKTYDYKYYDQNPQ